jgi:hypothetical protein
VGQKKSNAPHKPQWALLDLNFTSGVEFCQHLLASGDFELQLLRKLGKGSTKMDRAGYIASGIASNNISPDEVALAFCQQSRQWLCVRLGGCSMPDTQLRTAKEFLTEFGPDEAWYGPFHGSEEDRRWYVHALKVPHLHLDPETKTYTRLRIRWHVVAEVTDKYVAFHWNGFYHSGAAREDALSQFEYWNHIPTLFASLSDHLGGEWTQPPLHATILSRVVADYGERVEIEWFDHKIKAERAGVAISASSGSLKNITSGGGLRLLSDELAKSALAAMGVLSDQAKITAVGKALHA